MLASHLFSGQTIDFHIDRTVPDTTPNIEIRLTNGELNVVDVIKLTPTEAISLAERLHNLVDVVAQDITQHIQKEEPLLNLHPRAAELLAGADLNTTTGEHISNGNHLPEPKVYNVEIDESWTAHISNDDPIVEAQARHDAGIAICNHAMLAMYDRPLQPGESLLYWLDHDGNVSLEVGTEPDAETKKQLSATLTTKHDPELHQLYAENWQIEIDEFVNAFALVASKTQSDKKNVYFDVIEDIEVMDPKHRVRMPLSVSYHPWIRSKAMRKLILEVFQQAFRFGVSWENCRMEEM